MLYAVFAAPIYSTIVGDALKSLTNSALSTYNNKSKRVSGQNLVIPPSDVITGIATA
jgi:hypothetical protein